jgi:Bifunctional DNA primase/polymerase, N-terminal
VVSADPRGATTLAYALAYAALGWLLLPTWWVREDGSCSCGKPAGECKPGKHPVGPVAPNGIDNATGDPAILRGWLERYQRANLAVRTGPESGLLVLDVDGPEGERALVDLERRYGPLPELYPMQWTGGGRGGWQAFFAFPPGRTIGLSAGRLGRKLDTRGNRGYALVPPSVTTQPYRWALERGPASIPPEPSPAWLLDLLDPPAQPETPRDPWPIQSALSRGNGSRYAFKALESELALVAVAPAGRRNDQLNASSHALFRFAASGQLPADVVRRGLLAAALHAGLPEREALATISSAAKARGVGP